MKRVILLLLILWTFANAQPIGVKPPIIRNLPQGYRNVLLNFLVNNYEGLEVFKQGKGYQTVIQPVLSSITGSYNFCLDFIQDGKVKKIYCFSALDGESLAERLSTIKILKRKKPIKRYSATLTVKTQLKTKIYGESLKVVSVNGDYLLGYKKVGKADRYGNSITVIGSLNIDTVILSGKEGTKLFKALLEGYRFSKIQVD
ncbi:MAG: hypothetical protein GXO45_03455 [Aquificae bacterium]|nr:hypothetical protein [Aquificota bacterium]